MNRRMVKAVLFTGIMTLGANVFSPLSAESASMGSAAVEGGPAGNVARGEEVYNGTCVACHGEDGKGAVPGAPDFTKPDGVLSQSDEVLLDHMVHGFQSDGSILEMPPLGGDPELTESDMIDVLAYLRKAFNTK